MVWRELKNAVEWLGLVALVVLAWAPWETLIRWMKEAVKKPNRTNVV
jgi:hypothetical protein